MYNGQYAKGALHLVVFVVLLSAADNVNWVFYWLVWGWIFYQAFDAYHTAAARRDGLPLPNPFGWNDIGDRFGVHRSAGGVDTPPRSAEQSPQGPPPSVHFASPPPYQGYTAPSAAAMQAREEQSEARQDREAPAPRSVYEGVEARASDNPYAQTAGGPIPGPQNASAPSYMAGVPFSATYTGGPSPFPGPPVDMPAQKRFPVGALWLIGLGVVFLLGNRLPGLHLNGRWLVPFVLAGMACWSMMRRWEQYRVAIQAGSYPMPSLVGGLMGPALLLMLALLLSLDAASVLQIGRSWPLLLMAWGFMLLVKRVAQPVPGLVETSSRAAQGTSGPSSPGF